MNFFKNKTLIFSAIFFSILVVSCGDNTSSSINPCLSNPCAESLIPHKTVCELIDDTDFTCVCETGYELDVRTNLCIRPEIDPCDPNPCTTENKTKCIVRGGASTSPECQCNDGYHLVGENCVETVDPCDPNPCTEENKTKCIAVGVGDSALPECQCNDGYSEDTDAICQKLNDFTLRLMAANTTSGNMQSYDPGEGIRIFQATKPDVVMIQEFNYKDNDNSDYEELAGKIFNDPNCVQEGRCYYYAGSGQIPNGILSKYKILSRGYWDDPEIGNRDLNYAVIDLPGERDLFVVSVHLSTSGGEQTRPASIIAQNVTSHKLANPDKYYYAVGGDFNGTTSVSTSGFGKDGAFNINDPYPVSKTNNHDTNASREKHYDWILTSSNLSSLQVSSDFCNPSDENDCKKYTNGLVMDTREYTSTEINTYFSPTRLEDSGAINMQHMAIIKDFKILVE